MAERTVQQPSSGPTQERFSNLPTAEVDRSTFDMSHPWKGTMQTYEITPMLCMEILPGDTFNVNSTVFMRLATPLKPIMDNLTADIHYFFVPNRLVWDNFQFFMGERKNPTDDPTEVTIPQVNIDFNIRNINLVDGVLADKLGLPMYDPGDNSPQIGQVNALPFRSYSLIYNDWYRNQNLEPERTIPRDDGPDDLNDDYLHIGVRHKRADYFTRALPWPQKGDPVFLPLGDRAPLLGMYADRDLYPNDNDITVRDAKGVEFLLTEPYKRLNVENDPNNSMIVIENPDPSLPAGTPWLEVDLTEATAATINDIRTAFQIQKLLERDARGGSRYIELILSHFNVQSPDMRLQRPEYLGGGSSKIIVNPVAATVQTEDAPQGNLAAVGTGLLKGGFTHSFTEHGHIFALVSCRADLTYQRGLDRMWSRTTRYDFYWPSLSHLGEQAIKNQEVFYEVGEDAQNNDVWGYQERYAEMRYQPGRITGKFRSEDPESLDVWHLAVDYAELPNLNPLFTADFPPIDRIVAVPSEPDLIVDCWHDIKATRPMPIYAVPGLVDHF